MRLALPCRSSILPIKTNLLLASIMLLAGVGEAAAASSLRVLEIQSIVDSPCGSENNRRSPDHLTIEEVLLAGDEKMDLAQVPLPHGWRRTRSSGRPYALRQTTACAAPLTLETASEWARVRLANPAASALIRWGDETKWVDPTPRNQTREIELGSRQPRVRWSSPRMVPYQHSLAHRAALVSNQQGSHWVRFDQPYPLEPHPSLPSRSVSLPLRIEFPDVLVPHQAVLRFGIVAESADAQELGLRASLGSSNPGGPQQVRTRAGKLTWHEIALEGDASQHRSVVLTIEGRGELKLVDPGLHGREAIGPRRRDRPNFILITLDTVRADHLSIYGYGRSTTPFLEEIADEFLIFDAAYSQVPSTRPSHFSLFSSRYPRDLGIWNNGGPPLAQSEISVAELFQAAGWRTGALTSVRFLADDGGVSQGFDEVLLPPVATSPQLGEVTTERALDFMRANEARPFFLWIHYFDAHLPYQPRPEYRDLFWNDPVPDEVTIAPDLIEKEGFGTLFALPHRVYMTAMYDASLRYLDDQMRILFRFLTDHEMRDDTVVVIAADHGESLGEHGVYFAHDGLYEPTVRVPLLVALPGATKRGRVPYVVENLDIAPTLLDIAGLTAPDDFLGSTLLAETPGDGIAIFEHTGRLFTGIRRENLKWIDGRTFHGEKRFATSSLRELLEQPATALFDLETDPDEQTDLSLSQRDVANDLAATLQAWSAKDVDQERTARPRPIDAQRRQRLRALGYVE